MPEAGEGNNFASCYTPPPKMRFTAAFFVSVACAFAVAGCVGSLPEDNGAKAPSRRILVLSLDGLPYDLAQQKMAVGGLPAISALAARGASAAGGSVSCFPAMTAPGHATLWTGCWADRHKILGNDTPTLPKRKHSILEYRSGFDAAALADEPIWRVAARGGRSVTVVQATQADPANPEDSGIPSLNIFNGYRGIVKSALVTGPAFTADERTCLVEREGDGVAVSCAPVRVHVPPGTWVAFDHPQISGVFYVYLARIDAEGWALLRSSYNAVAAPTPQEAALFRREVGGYAYNATQCEPTLLDGTPWKREAYLAAARLNAEQVRRATLWALKAHPAEMTITYLPQPDAVLHELLGKAELWGDRDASALIDDVLAICDKLAADLAAAVPDGAIAVVSDHGMAPVDKVFFPNLALERAGLLARNEAGGINLAQTQVVYARSGDFVVVNTVDHLGGSVKTDEKEAWLAMAEREIVHAAEASLGAGALVPPLRPGAAADGPLLAAEGDSWFSSACDGVRLYARLSPELPAKDSPLVRQIPPIGYHSGDPRISRLHAVMIFAGTGFLHAEVAGVRHVDFAPTVLRWLDVEPPTNMAGKAMEEFLEKR